MSKLIIFVIVVVALVLGWNYFKKPAAEMEAMPIEIETEATEAAGIMPAVEMEAEVAPAE